MVMHTILKQAIYTDYDRVFPFFAISQTDWLRPKSLFAVVIFRFTHLSQPLENGNSQLCSLYLHLFMFCLLLVGCNASTSKNNISLLRKQVHAFCCDSAPYYLQESRIIAFPVMDDKTLLACVNLARIGDTQLYGDLAAVILRVNKLQMASSKLSIPFEMTQDIPRIFAARYAYCWNVPGDDPLLIGVAEWIIENRSQFMDSQLFRKEIDLLQKPPDPSKKQPPP